MRLRSCSGALKSFAPNETGDVTNVNDIIESRPKATYMAAIGYAMHFSRSHDAVIAFTTTSKT